MATAFAQTAPMRKQHEVPPAVVFANGPFDGFTRENGSAIFTPKHETDPRLAKILEAWERYRVVYNSFSGVVHFEDCYAAALNAISISNISCSARDLDAFVNALSRYPVDGDFEITAGLFVSALINDGFESCYTIHTNAFDKELHLLGYQNRKQITIVGNTGLGTGSRMESGEITVIGNAGDNVGLGMQNGILTVDGNAEETAGYRMSGGSLIIKGSANRFAGNEMQGGALTIERDAGDSAGMGMRGGKLVIYGNAGAEIGGMENVMRFGRDYLEMVMTNGEICIYGKCKSINQWIVGGRIFVCGVQIYPHLVPEPEARLE